MFELLPALQPLQKNLLSSALPLQPVFKQKKKAVLYSTSLLPPRCCSGLLCALSSSWCSAGHPIASVCSNPTPTHHQRSLCLTLLKLRSACMPWMSQLIRRRRWFVSTLPFRQVRALYFILFSFLFLFLCSPSFRLSRWPRPGLCSASFSAIQFVALASAERGAGAPTLLVWFGLIWCALLLRPSSLRHLDFYSLFFGICIGHRRSTAD